MPLPLLAGDLLHHAGRRHYEALVVEVHVMVACGMLDRATDLAHLVQRAADVGDAPSATHISPFAAVNMVWQSLNFAKTSPPAPEK